MSSIYRPLTSPTVVEHSAAVVFVQKHEVNLIIARNNLLQVFQLTQHEEDLTSAETDLDVPTETLTNEDDFIGAGLSIRTSERQIVTKLILVTEYHLHGSVSSLGAVRAQDYHETGLEYLLVAFESAKLSLLRWDQDTHNITTVSLHSFERDEYRSPLTVDTKSILRIDPLSRVATLSFYGDHFAFLPISQRDELLIDEQDEDDREQGPIRDSFVLSVSQLEDGITQLLDFDFVDGYREPAMAILYATEGTAVGLTDSWRKDTCRLVVLTLDIQAGARTAIFDISDLPSDLRSIFAVPGPVGGCLLIGANEVMYIDSASRVVALGVNAFAKRSTAWPMRDYSALNLQLEGCLAVPLQEGSNLDGILLVLANGTFGLLTLNLDGRTVSSLHLKVITDDFGGGLLSGGANCATLFDGKRVFLGGLTGDSKLLAWRKKARASTENITGGSIIQDAVLDVKEEERDQLDDLAELYGDEATEKKLFGAEKTAFDLRFYSHETLINHGPITGITLGCPFVDEDHDSSSGLGASGEVAAVSGSGRAGKLSIFRQNLAPDIIGKFEAPDWQFLWTVRVRTSTTEQDNSVSNSLDTYLMASKAHETQVFTIDTAFIEKTDSEFETSDATVFVGTLLDCTCIVQICADMMRTYDADLKLLEMKPTPEECKIVSASVVDPYVLLVLDNAELALYSGSSETMELAEVTHDMNGAGHIVCATLYSSRHFDSCLRTASEVVTESKKRKRDQNENREQLISRNDCLCFVVTGSGHLCVYSLPSMRRIFYSTAFSTYPALLLNEDQIPSTNGSSVENNEGQSLGAGTVLEIMVSDLGQRMREPYMIVRVNHDEIVTYRPFCGADGSLRFAKVSDGFQHPSRQSGNETRHQSEGKAGELVKPQMIYCSDVGGYACVFLRSEASYWLLKTDHSLPSIRPAGLGTVCSLSGFNTLDAEQGFIYCDNDNNVRICRFPIAFDFTNQWSSKSLSIGRSVHAVAYYAQQQVYAILTSSEQHFEIPDEEDEEWQPEQHDREELPLLARGAIELVDSRTFKVIDRYELADNEQGLCLKAVELTIATEYTKKKRSCLAVSTGLLRGEDLAMRGAVYVFDVVEVVPEIGQQDSKYRLKNVCREEVKAAATTLCEVDGYLLSSQGQKVVVRSLEEDERLTPVAFVDLGLATTTSKCIKGMVLFGDIQRGVRLVGFGEEPYKMTSFGRDFETMDVLDTEFLVDGRNLYCVASDPEGNIRVLQYDPENPTTLAGSRLVRRADIHSGHVITSMVLVPLLKSYATDSSMSTERTMVLCASQDGSLSAIMPVSERSYRRLYTIQAQIASTEVQVAGLNPRAYRHCTTEGLTTNAARGILDGMLLSSFIGLDVATQTQLARKSGVGVSNVLSDLSDLQKAISFL